MSTNVDERLLGRWLESQQRQEQMRARLADSSLPAERFEDWALDLIAEALSTPHIQKRARQAVAPRPLSFLDARSGGD